MDLIYLNSFVFILLAIAPLWWDAKRRPEYGPRPRTLLLSMLLFIALAALAFCGRAFGLAAGSLRPMYFLTLLVFYPFIFVIAEYSVHRQRIKKNLLESEYHSRQRWIVLLAAGVVLCTVLLWVLFFPNRDSEATAYADPLIKNFNAFTGLAYFIFIMACSIYGMYLFDLQEGIIRKRSYPFTISSSVIAIAVILNAIFPANATLLYYPLLALNLLYAARVFHEYFLYRMHHLNANSLLRKSQDEARTALINNVLTSSPGGDVEILTKTLTGFLDRLRDSVSNPNLRVTSMMLFRRRGNLLAVDSRDFIIDHCVPLMNLESLKRMKTEATHEHIISQVFELDQLAAAVPADLDFAQAAIRQMMEIKTAVAINPLPQYLGQLFRSITLNPVFNQDQLNAMLVIFKANSDYVFPQEKVIIDDLVNYLSIATTLIEGKRVQEDKNRLNQEMDVAKRIQVSVLPKAIVMDGYDVAAEMITATEVGGDLYDFLPSRFGNYLDVGDVAGHGLPAGMMALLHMAALHGAIHASERLNKPLEPHQLYDIINQVLVTINRDRIGSDKFMTGNVLCEKDGEFRYAGSHMTALVYRAADDAVVEIPGMIDRAAYLGISELAESSKSQGDFKLLSGDVLLLYTDGLTEARDRSDQFFGLKNLKLALETNAKKPAEELKQAVLKALADFAESGDRKKYNGSYADDVSLLVVKRT